MAEERRHISQLNLLSNPAPDDELLAQDKSEGTGAGADAYKRLPLSEVALLGTAQTWTATQTFSAIRTGDTGPIFDDNVVVLSSVPGPCMLLLWPESGATPSIIASFRPAAPSSQLIATNNLDHVTVMTGVLTGTTGTDGDVNLSCSGGNVYIENRRGFGIRFFYLVLG